MTDPCWPFHDLHELQRAVATLEEHGIPYRVEQEPQEYDLPFAAVVVPYLLTVPAEHESAAVERLGSPFGPTPEPGSDGGQEEDVEVTREELERLRARGRGALPLLVATTVLIFVRFAFPHPAVTGALWISFVGLVLAQLRRLTSRCPRCFTPLFPMRHGLLDSWSRPSTCRRCGLDLAPPV